MRQRAAASLLYQSQYAEPAFRNLQKSIFLKIVGRILALYNYRPHTTPEGERAKVEKENKIQGGLGRTQACSLQGLGYPGTFIIGSNLLSLTSHTIGIYRSLV